MYFQKLKALVPITAFFAAVLTAAVQSGDA